VKRETGKLPAALLLTHVDYLYGNLNDAKAVGKVAEEYKVPFILNCAYSAGIMPVDGREVGADVITSSGHKSWAASAPTGILALRGSLGEKVLAKPQDRGGPDQKEVSLEGAGPPRLHRSRSAARDLDGILPGGGKEG